MYKYVLNSVVKISMMFAKHFEYYTIILRGAFLWTRFMYIPYSSPSRELEETTRPSPYHVAEHRPARSDSLQPDTERSSRPGSEPPSVEADVYIWRYALLVVHARKEEENCIVKQTCQLEWQCRIWILQPCVCCQQTDLL